jgi:protein SCO1/2
MKVAPPLSSPGPRWRAAAALLGLLLLPTPAAARLSAAELGTVAVSPEPGARVPLDLPLTDAAADRPTSLGAVMGGRPALLLPVDYTCGNVCDPMIGLSADALAATGLPAGDRRLVLVGLDPRDDAATARGRIAGLWGGRADAPAILVAGTAEIARLTEALGYRYAYDAGTDSFAHPAAALLVTGDGRLARVLSPLALNGKDLRLALTEAGDGRVGTLADHLALLCYGYDAAKGVYTPLIGRILTGGGVLTILGIGGLILALVRIRSRQEARARI